MLLPPKSIPNNPNRRQALKTGLALGGVSALYALPVSAQPAPVFSDSVSKAIAALYGDTPIQSGKVRLKLPPLSENGYSVAFEVEADSPMHADDHITDIALFSDRNPVPLLGRYHFTEHSGRARVTGRIRLAGTQSVHAIARMHDGSLWHGSAETIVTIAACIIM